MDPVITSPPHPDSSWISVILGSALIIAGVTGGLKAFISGYRKKLPAEEISISPPSPGSGDWSALCSRADSVIGETIAQFPADIAAEAKKVPCLFKERADHESRGYRTLGTYHNFIPGRKSSYAGPIFLYLKSIEEACAQNHENFETQVKTTYLHELGHHFGWDEVDLARHGLPSGRPPGK